MFEEDDNKENYNTFGYEDEEELKISQSNPSRMLQKVQLERKKRKGNIWILRLHILLRFIIIVGLIYLMSLMTKLPQWYVDKNIFTTTSPNLEIVNNRIVPTYKILNELRNVEVIDEPIYKFETGKIKSNLLSLEPIEDIYIRRYWFPARLKIILKERIPVISLYRSDSDNAVAFYTEDGVLIGGDYLPLPDGVKTLKVISSDDYRDWDKAKIDKIINLSNYVEQVSKEKCEYFDLKNQNDVYIKLQDYLLRIGQMDATAYERISRLSSILPNMKQVKEPVKYIDLRWSDAIYLKTE